jgi:hypothetical protein
VHARRSQSSSAFASPAGTSSARAGHAMNTHPISATAKTCKFLSFALQRIVSLILAVASD